MKTKPSRPSRELIDDIIIWGGRVPSLLGEMSFDEFVQDYKTYLAVWKCIEVVGEASGSLLRSDHPLSPELKEQLRFAYLMRNRLSHGYPGVDLRILWTTARQSIPRIVELAGSIAVENDDP